MRRLRYQVAASLDGYIAGPNGEYDWIVHDSSIDFAAHFRQFDTVLMGRKTFELVLAQHPDGAMPGLRVIVCSRTLRGEDYPKVTVLRDDVASEVAALKRQAGNDIWLFGGGVLFRHLLDAGVVDTVEVALMPILIGGGIPLVAAGRRSPRLHLEKCEPLPSGIVMMSYRTRS